jgi:hypothetical protein
MIFSRYFALLSAIFRVFSRRYSLLSHFSRRFPFFRVFSCYYIHNISRLFVFFRVISRYHSRCLVFIRVIIRVISRLFALPFALFRVPCELTTPPNTLLKLWGCFLFLLAYLPQLLFLHPSQLFYLKL